ncbi:MAG: cytidine deaminase [Spirochaetales bacterium]|nr:MAG: cytidine deaminase [Spirochaetales bacterium]
MKAEELMDKAREAALKAYAPYSRFRVGAALLLDNGSVITGVNVENRSFGLSNCAERSAIFTAISAGFKNFKAVAVAGPDAWEPLSPCGACRQVLSEFCPPDTPVYYDDSKGGYIESSVGGLYPANALSDLSEKIK